MAGMLVGRQKMWHMWHMVRFPAGFAGQI